MNKKLSPASERDAAYWNRRAQCVQKARMAMGLMDVEFPVKEDLFRVLGPQLATLVKARAALNGVSAHSWLQQAIVNWAAVGTLADVYEAEYEQGEWALAVGPKEPANE